MRANAPYDVTSCQKKNMYTEKHWHGRTFMCSVTIASRLGNQDDTWQLSAQKTKKTTLRNRQFTSQAPKYSISLTVT